MGYYLTIDEGNSSAKMALWEGSVCIREARFEDITPTEAAHFTGGVELTAVAYSSVKTGDSKILSLLPAGVKVYNISSSLPIPITLDYSTPTTLGADRIAAAAGASVISQGESALIVDIGTAVTYDFLDSRLRFEGGNIAPGIEMRLNALNKYTSALPAVDPHGDTPLLGKTTAEAMRSGAVLGVAAETEYYRSQLKPSHSSFITILTGGGAELVAPHISLPFRIVPNLVMLGLKRILDYNESL